MDREEHSMKINNLKKPGLFAAVLRAKSCIMKTATTVQENCEDIYADAKTINETKYNTEEVVLDSVDEDEEA